MTLPEGVTTATVTFGGDTGFDGNPVRADLTFTPSVEVIHTESGQRLFRSPIPGRAEFGATGSVVLPHTNQAGLADSAGRPVSGFHYRVQGTYTTVTGAIERVDREFLIPSGETTVDVDTAPGVVEPPDRLEFTGKRAPIEIGVGADWIYNLWSPPGIPFPTGMTGRVELLTSQVGSKVGVWPVTNSDGSVLAWNVQSDAPGGVDAMQAAGASWYRLYGTFPAVPPDDALWLYGPVEFVG